MPITYKKYGSRRAVGRKSFYKRRAAASYKKGATVNRKRKYNTWKVNRKTRSQFRTKRVKPWVDKGGGGEVSGSRFTHKNKMPRFMSYSGVIKSLTQSSSYWQEKKLEIQGSYNNNAKATALYLWPTTDLAFMIDKYFPSADVAQPQPTSNSRVLLEHVSGMMTIQNATNVMSFVTIYTLQSKSSHISKDSTANLSPENLWDLGTEQQVGAVSDITLYPGWKPNNTSKFNQYWKIVGRDRVRLHSGASHEHKFFIQLNKIITYNGIITGEIGTGTALPGYTYAFFIVANGQLGVDSIAKDQMGSAITDLLTWSVFKYKFRGYTADTRVSYFGSRVPTSIADLYVINEDDGNAEVMQSAGQAVV